MIFLTSRLAADLVGPEHNGTVVSDLDN